MMRKAIEGNHLNRGHVTVDMKTGEVKPHTPKMFMLPAKEGTCEECAVAHDPSQPHNPQSMFYQYKFYNEHGKWPNWIDAMAHCEEVVRENWRSHLCAYGVDVDGGKITPGGK